MRANRTRKGPPKGIPDLSTLKYKPQWWLDMHKPVEVEAYKMPFGISAKAEFEGVQYEGMLYPVKDERAKE